MKLRRLVPLKEDQPSLQEVPLAGQFPTYPNSYDVGVLCLQQSVNLPQRRDGKPLLLLLHLQSLQSHDLVRLLVSCPVNDTERPLLDAV